MGSTWIKFQGKTLIPTLTLTLTIGVEFCFYLEGLKFEDEVHEWHDLLMIVRIVFYGKLITADRYWHGINLY